MCQCAGICLFQDVSLAAGWKESLGGMSETRKTHWKTVTGVQVREDSGFQEEGAVVMSQVKVG